jgi:O-antigen/teichoic acid export membrane protein
VSGHQLIHAFKWSLASEIAAKAIQPIIFIVLARLLTPEDFGVMFAALMVIGFSQIFWEAGMGKALIQRQTDIEDAANVAFWINIGLGVVVAILLFTAASAIAQVIFHDARVTTVLQVMTLQVLLGAISSVHTALLQKEMGFKKLFWVRFATVSLPGLASIPLAWNGMGYWALVVGTLTGQAAQAIMLWRMSPWMPRKIISAGLTREMGRFGAWVGASGLLAWFYVWADSLIVGIYLGSHELGLYQTGNQFVVMAFAILFGPVTPVLYSHLSRMHQDRERMRHLALKLIKAITFVAIPVGIEIYFLAPPLATALFGSKWQGIEMVIGTMALTHGFAWVVGMNGEVYRAMGRPAAEAIVPAASLPIYVGVYLLSIGHGLEVFVWARFGLALGTLSLHLLVLRAILSMPILPIARYLLLMVLIAGIPALAVRYLLIEHMGGPWWQLVGGGTVNLALVVGILFMVERNGMLKELQAMLRGREV